MRLMLLCVFLTSCLANNSVARETAKPIFSDQFANIGADGLPEGWEVWNARNMAQLFEPNDEITLSGGHSMRVSGNGNYHTKGSLKKTLTGLQTGEYYKVVVRYTTRGLSRGINSRIFPVIKWTEKSRRWQPLEPVAIDKGWLTAEVIHHLTPEAKGSLRVELFSGWIPEGSVYWDSVEVYHLPSYTPPKPRNVNVAVIDSRPGKFGSEKDNCDFYVSQINYACQQEKLDVICMTEEFNQLDVSDQSSTVISMDGEYMTRIKQAACDNHVNLVGSFQEDDGGVTFNTGFLIDREGKVAGKYRKAQLAMTEILFNDHSQGDEVKVIQADFGKIGILICWDYQFPEFARSLSLKGAEILFCPIAGCARLTEEGRSTGMEHVGKSVAIENRVPVVFSRRAVSNTASPSLIVNSHAQIVASSNKEPYFSATVELAAPISHWGGSAFSSEYFTSRRPELYGILSDDSLRIRTPNGTVTVPEPSATPQSLETAKAE